MPETDACRMRGQMRVYPEKKRKKKQIRIWADMHVAQVSTFGGRPFFLCTQICGGVSVCALGN